MGGISLFTVSKYPIAFNTNEGLPHWHFLNDHNSVTICARDRIKRVSEMREDELYGDIRHVMVAQSFHKVLCLNTEN